MSLSRRQIVLSGGLGLVAIAGTSLFAWQQSVFQEIRNTDNVPVLRPFQKSLRVQNIDTLVIDAGEGPPVLFFHGIPDTTDVWAGSIIALKDRFRCIAFDMPGFGKSHAVDGTFDWTLQNRADYVREILDKLGITEPVRIVAHDAGGVWGGVFAAAYSERVERALFSISSIHPSFEWRDGAKLQRVPILGELATAAFNEDRFVASLKDFSGPNRSEASMLEVYNRVDGRMRKAILRFYRETEVTEFKTWHSRYLAGIKEKPVRVIWGKLNPAATPEDGVRSYPTDDLIVYPNAGHWPMLEEPDRWANDLSDFLQKAA
ncbi:MAG: alpha/beta fold hydrolase [Sphingorhabdus sp.]